MVLMEGGAQAPQITVLGAGAPVGAVVVVALAGLIIYALYVFKPAIERLAGPKPEPHPAPPPAPSCTGCCAFAGVDPEQIGELLRHNERLYLTLHEGTQQAGADSPIALIRYSHGRIETIWEWVRRQEAAEEAQEEADRKEVAEAIRSQRDETNPGRKPR